MEETPKVHRHRHRRTESRHRRNEQQQQITRNVNSESKSPARCTQESIRMVEEGESELAATAGPNNSIAAVTTRLLQENERQYFTAADETNETIQNTQTVLLVNGYAPQDNATENGARESSSLCTKSTHNDNNEPDTGQEAADYSELAATDPPEGPSSSRNSSGDAMSLRETLQQLPPTITAHRHRRTLSPHSPSHRVHETAADASFHRGILGLMDRELKQASPTPSALSAGSGTGPTSGNSRKHQSLSDPTASPAQRSVRSRSSLEKSPRRKRSKSESRRRRERKLIAAGEMEVRQANETLMRYLKQCSELNDASLSGELEIDQSLEERRVHRKTKSQRDKRGHIISKIYSGSGISSILRELSDDIVPAEGEEIYNPFTPVVSPTDDMPTHIDKMFIQTSSGYRPVEPSRYYKHLFMRMSDGGAGGSGVGVGVSGPSVTGGMRGHHGNDNSDSGCIGDGVAASSGSIIERRAGFVAGYGLRSSSSCGDTRCLLMDGEYHRYEPTTNIELACVAQRVWLLISNICHGLLAGLALAHLLFVLSSNPTDWSKVLSLAGETYDSDEQHQQQLQKQRQQQQLQDITVAPTSTISLNPDATEMFESTLAIKADYATFANIYINTFYCLAIICMVSVLDRMDICRWSLANATELISFRWLIIAMIYIATIILTICSDSLDERLYFTNNANITVTPEELITNSVLSMWSSLSISRSIGAICGWFMVGLTPHSDLLYDHLIDLTRYQVANN